MTLTQTAAVELGKIAYEAYCVKTGGKSLATGDDLPPFDNLRPAIQEAWTVAATAVYVEVMRQVGPA